MKVSDNHISNNHTVVSLFSGAGGLDLGFKMENFEILWANDFDKDACSTYRTNIGNHIVEGDINKCIDQLHDYSNQVDVLIGGPPCQGFSVAGKMNPDDPRNKNIWAFLKAVEIVQPKVFVMENVKALAELDKWKDVRVSLLNGMRRLGYAVSYTVVNASDYNVPQNRERVLFIGFKNESQAVPDLGKMIEQYIIHSPVVKEVLKKLDKAGTGNNSHTCKAKITLTDKPILRKSAYAGMLFNGMGRPVKLNGYCATLPASMGGNKTPIIDENELYNDSASWVESYHKGIMSGTIVPKYQEAPPFLRRMTVEEAALLQTFPLGYCFNGSQSSVYKQIGNAVPCNLAHQVAKMIKDYLLDNGKGSLVFESTQLSLFA